MIARKETLSRADAENIVVYIQEPVEFPQPDLPRRTAYGVYAVIVR